MERTILSMAIAVVINFTVASCAVPASAQSRNFFIGNGLTNDILSVEVLVPSGTPESLQVSQHVRCDSSLTATIAAVNNPTQSTVCVPTAGQTGLDLGIYPDAFQQDIDRLILQPSGGATLRQEIDSIVRLIDFFHSNPLNSDDQVFIYSTWGLNTGVGFISTWNNHQAALDQEFVQSKHTYELLLEELERRGYDVGLIPAGQAFADIGTSLLTESIGDLSSVSDLYRDTLSANDAGRYLGAVTAYLSLTGGSEQEITLEYSDSTGSDVGGVLRAAAAQAVANSKVRQDQIPRFALGSRLMLVGDSFSNDGIFDWAGKVDYSPEFDVDYFSESGRTLFTMANLFEDQYSENTYSGIVIAGGVNDIAGRLTLGSMQTSVATMIAQTNDEHIILLTIPPFRAIASINDQNRQDIANQFDDWIFELAANDSRISVFNIRDILDADGNEFIDPGLSFDGLHPYGCAPGAECPQQMIASRFIAQFSEAAVPVLGDFDRNLVVDGADVNDYRGTFGYSASGSFARLDLTENGTIEKADLAFLVENLVETSNGQVGTFLGDVNFDGTVDVLRDAVTLIIHLGNDVDGYYYGDIDLNGTVDVLGDVFVLISNLGKSNAP